MNDKFTIIRKGYSPEEVNEYINTSRNYISNLESKNRENENKINGLINELAVYKQKETSINNAIINSQISADSILLNARNAAENIIKNAKNEAEMAKEAVSRLMSDILVSLIPQRKNIQSFRRDYEGLLSKYVKDMDDDDFDIVNKKFDALEEYIKQMTDSV